MVTIEEAIETIPKDERRRMLWIMVSDLEEADEVNWDVIVMLEGLTGEDLFDNYDDKWDDRDPSWAANEGYMKLARKLEEVFGIQFTRETHTYELREKGIGSQRH